MRKITEKQAHDIITSQCKQFVEDTPANESGADEDARFENLARFLSFAIGADVYEKAMHELDEVVTTLQELQSLDTLAHPDIELNESRTVDNRDIIRERLDMQMSGELYSLLQSAAFRPAKKVAA